MSDHRQDTLTLRVVDIISGTSVDGPGLRTSIYVAGCSHKCPGCHNPSTWDFKAGKEYSINEVCDIVDEYGLDVTLSGGDPLYQTEAVALLCEKLKSSGRNIWLYTGFVYEQLPGNLHTDPINRILDNIDMMVDGPFVESLKDSNIIFRGSSNQRIIDIPASLKAGHAVVNDYYMNWCADPFDGEQ